MIEITFGLDEPDTDEHVRARVAAQVGVAPEDLPEPILLRRSLDARRGRVRFRCSFRLDADSSALRLGPTPREVQGPRRVAIIGGGPAGLFAAHELACAGVPCTVIDRGKPVQPRRRDLKGLNRHGVVDPDSNYCFGEGGAGTYSDGKLYTRAHKRGDLGRILGILAAHGAPEAILTDARPHIGSNRLPKVVAEMRRRLEEVGVEFRFEQRVIGLLRRPAPAGYRVIGLELAGGGELAADHVVVATGHSARDVFRMLAEAGEELECKPFALGVRVEHPQPLINRIQYGASAGHPRLPSAAYRLVHSSADNHVFSFCMCPGGWVVPASTAPGEVVVNGMSLSKRDSPYANAGVVVAIDEAMLARAGFTGPFAGLEAQTRLERAAQLAGGGGLRAPATRLGDLIARRGSSTVPKSSYIPGLAAGDIAEVLDVVGLGLSDRLREGIEGFARRMPGYLTDEAVAIGVESRTSSPIRVVRHPVSCEASRHRGLFPTGEGAGYAGGIMSAALDGQRVARRIIESLEQR